MNKTHAIKSNKADSLRILQTQLNKLGRFLSVPNSYRITREYITEYNFVNSNHGNNFKLKLFKFYYECLKSEILGTPIPPLPANLWIRTAKDGMPSFINRLLERHKIDIEDRGHQRFILSLFSSYEIGSVSNPQVNTKSITDFQTKKWSEGLVKKFTSFTYNEKFVHKLSKRVRLSKAKDYVSFKGGPFGPLSPSWTADLLALYLNPLMLDKLCDLEKFTGFQGSSSLANTIKEIPLKSKNNLSLISSSSVLPLVTTLAIPDKGPKVRVISKGNYYLQRALKPIHIYMMDILKLIPEDGTYEQRSSAKLAREWTRNGTQPTCYDLTAFTDRFPIDLEYLVLHSFNPSVAKHFKRIMTNVTSLNEETKEFIQFNVGQPMGLYSSWASASLTHHFIIRFAFDLCNKSPKNGYSIIGDDCIIKDEQVAEVYRDLIEGMGVGISINKSVIPKLKINNVNSAEMAKRLFINGTEISPIRPRDLVSLRAFSYSWIHIKSFALEIKERWGDEQFWKLILDKSDTSTNPSFSLLSFLKGQSTQRTLGREFLESPFGGPRIKFLALMKVNKNSNQVLSKDILETIPGYWDDYSDEWISKAVEVIADEKLDNIVQKLSDILATFELINALPNTQIKPIFSDFDSYHQFAWNKLEVNPFYQATLSIQRSILELWKNPTDFMFGEATGIIEKIDNFEVSLDLITDWITGKVKRDLSDNKKNQRLISATKMLKTKKIVKQRLELLSSSFRGIPDPTEDGIASTELKLFSFHGNLRFLKDSRDATKH